ncbi:S26 family signal peptidase [Stutzerimonas stutzeri]|uniref:S26 family signal peptidase n=1 Tax=Stutzerimonas stutzeri TaxID=316 RepID=UPI0005EB4A26|nr:S26 family signal peptidase [Stutzerimonas stutzeri]
MRRRTAILLLAIVGTAWVASSGLFELPVRVVYNASDSVPSGWYRIDPDAVPRVGDLVLVRLPSKAAQLASQRGYLPIEVPMLKPVFAAPPQRACAIGSRLLVDGATAVAARAYDGRGRPMPQWRGCRPLVDDELLLLSPSHADSFDSRYFGPVSTHAVLGTAHRLFDK